MRRRAEGPGVYGPYKHGDKFRVHFVTRRGRARKTSYETFDTRSAAQACYDAARDEAQGISVSDAIKAYVDVTRARGRAELTIKAYKERLEILLGAYRKRPLRSVVARGAELYAAVLAGRSADSHQNLLVAGKLWGKWCVKQKWLRTNPFADVEPIGKRVHGADKVRLTINESRTLEAWCLAHPSDQGAALTLGYLYLGARNTELAQRDVRDLDDNGRVLSIRKSKSSSGRRALAIPDGLREMLLARCAGRPADAPIFVNALGKRMGSNCARDHVYRICEAAGVTPVPPQALRRTNASVAAEVGEMSIAIARHLGHANAKVTEQSYIERDAADAGRGERFLRVVRGGRP